LYDLGRVVNGVHMTLRKIVVEETDQSAATDSDKQNVFRLRLDQQGGHHIPGIKKDQVVGVGKGDPALEDIAGKIE
jgi:hypothetical protein